MLFYVSFGRRPDAITMDRRQPLEHAIGVHEITALQITLRHRKPWSAAVQAVERLGVATFIAGAERLLEVWFDGEQLAQAAGFRPELRSISRW
jgi:hypothetical protein